MGTLTMTTPEAIDTCADCAGQLDHCHDVSIEHADGSTECTDSRCEIRHWEHQWQLPCSALVPPCPCNPEEHGGYFSWIDDAELEVA